MDEFPVGVIADETDPRALAAAVRSIIENRAKYTPSVQQRHQIIEQYGWQAQKRKLLVLYARLMPRRN
jgi:hypothetical protein